MSEAPTLQPDAPAGSLFVPGIPAPKGSTKAFYIKKLGRAVVTHDNKRTRPWEQAILAELLALHPQIIEGAVVVAMTFWMPRPRGHFRGGAELGGKNGLRPAAPRSHLVRPDVDKLARVVLDAMTGVVYRDDAQVTTIEARKHYATDGVQTSGVRIEWGPA